MLKELFELVKSSAQDRVINNPDIPNDKNNEVIAEATNTVASGLRNIVAGGGVQNLLSLFGAKGGAGNLMSNPIVSMMIGHFANKLMNNYGLGASQAGNVAGGLIPDILGNLVRKTNDPGNNTFSPQSQGGGIGLPDIFNESSNQGGGGLMDIVRKMAEGAQGQQQKNGGGLLDLIRGFTR